ncbi:hypothetical protein COCOBI_03-4620 [Coccomyxa sp. Obi]|nr:hypothetical protein COCOBI_03-4620 [Coccomyxa sp. Obi]
MPSQSPPTAPAGRSAGGERWELKSGGMGDWNPEGPIGQIVRTTAESQKIVAARPLYFLQHRVRAKSSARDLPQ